MLQPTISRTTGTGPRVALALLLVVLATPGLLAQSTLRFVTPRNMATALGPTDLELALDGPPGVSLVRIELFVDGRPLVTLSQPPWKTVWDAGDASRGHRITAVAQLSDGTRAEAVLNTSALRINQVEQVDLVNLYVIVRGRSEGYVTDLAQDDFRILEDGRPQVIQRFTTEQKQLNIGIVLDTSLTMRGNRLDVAQKAALNFLEVLQPGDQAMVVPFSDEVHVPDALTDDRQVLARAIESTVAQGGTALYDAIWKTARRLRDFEGRRVIVLLSDGKDEAASGLEPGSLHTLDEALDQALRSEAMVFAIGLGRGLRDLDFYRRETVESILSRLAGETGGRVVFLTRAGQLKKAFQSVALDLRHQYSLAYASDDRARDGKWRRIRITVPDRDVEVITRKGYFAPGHERGATAASH